MVIRALPEDVALLEGEQASRPQSDSRQRGRANTERRAVKPEDEKPRSRPLGGSLKGFVTGQAEVYKVGTLTRRQALGDLAEALGLLGDYDEGLVDIESLAWRVGQIGARVGLTAAGGELRVAS